MENVRASIDSWRVLPLSMLGQINAVKMIVFCDIVPDQNFGCSSKVCQLPFYVQIVVHLGIVVAKKLIVLTW
ncbi:hypothetical protein GOODEAATRI_031963, partial [Goodea atripinnis]